MKLHSKNEPLPLIIPHPISPPPHFVMYGVPRQKSSAKEISSSTTLAFTSQLSSLLSNSNTSRASSGRTRPSHSKSDIFTAHNRDTSKRAAKDVHEHDSSIASKRQNIGSVDDGVLHKSKRKMEEKARLYASMKRGNYVPPDGDETKDERGLVDFDKKWAEDEARGQSHDYDNSSNEDDGGSEGEMVVFEDEFGRQRRGTKAEAAREDSRRKVLAADEPDRFSARPSQPANLIYGDTVQAAAFNPDEPIAAQMQDLAEKRDRSATPPEELHYDATAEVRSKGVAFYSFSKDKEGRKKEMEGLERERTETEKGRQEKEARKQERKAEILARRNRIRGKRGEAQAERFLNNLVGEMDEKAEKAA
ncbi:MAG: hypothetical protein M1827_002743 [Pycnora praestabilis]|nr:MAG: hypothetical protein M1827_002743 [Pycnora praestabilis]